MIFYFGTFNPVHNGHIYIANLVEELYNDKVYFVPAYDSPFKPNITEFSHRYNMLVAANVRVTNIEKYLTQPSYTSQTVAAIRDLYKVGKVKFIIGYDQFLNIEKWHDYTYLKHYCYFIVIPRAGEKDVYKRLQQKVEQGFIFSVCAMPPIDTSSTQIRKGVNRQIPFSVERYIETHKLY